MGQVKTSRIGVKQVPNSSHILRGDLSPRVGLGGLGNRSTISQTAGSHLVELAHSTAVEVRVRASSSRGNGRGHEGHQQRVGDHLEVLFSVLVKKDLNQKTGWMVMKEKSEV